jgi:hypothetical protein
MVSQRQQKEMIEMAEDIEESESLAVMARIGPSGSISSERASH